MFGSLKKLFGGEEKDGKVIAAPVSGKAVPMSQVNDPTFSQEILGIRNVIMQTCSLK